MNLDILLEITKFLDNDTIITGSVADYFLIDFKDVRDFDFFISRSSFLKIFNVKTLHNRSILKDDMYLLQCWGYQTLHTIDENLELKKITNALVYRGHYKNIDNKVDIIILKNIDYPKVYNEINIKNQTLKIMPPKERFASLSRPQFRKIISTNYTETDQEKKRLRYEERVNLYKIKYQEYI
jgi:hypothetical protein